MKAKEQFINEHLQEPTLEDLSKVLDISVEDILVALDAIQDPVSLQEPIFSDGGDAIYMMDQLCDNDVSEDQWVTYFTVKDSFQKLDTRQKKILTKRIYYGATQTEIAMDLGLSQAQISRLEKSALSTIQSQLNP